MLTHRTDDIECLSPMRHKEYLNNGEVIGNSPYAQTMSTQRGIMTRDFLDVKRSDVLLVNLLKSDRISMGTVMEIAWGYQFRKPVVLVMEEDNLHQHPMICEAASFIVPTLEEGVRVVRSLLNISPY